jgi:signal transduction histidine kinase
VLRIEDDGESVTDVGKYVAAHRRQPDGSWRKAVEIFNWNTPCPGEREPDVRARPLASPAAAGPTAAEIQASRARIVEAADEARRRLERDLHDGAQQRLVLAVLTLKRAQSRAQGTPAEDLIVEAAGQLEQGLAELRELARGLHPNVLTERGLHAALGVLAASSPVPVELRVECERAAPTAEAAVYFTVAEALTNIAKHSGATRVSVDVDVYDGTLVAEIADDGVGGASTAAGSGLRGLVDRLDVLGGGLTIDSPPDDGTVIRAHVPLGPHPQGDVERPPKTGERREGDSVA